MYGTMILKFTELLFEGINFNPVNGKVDFKLIKFANMQATQHILLTLRRLTSYIYIYMEHPFLMFLDHTRRRSTVGRTPLDE